jgi:hypothetical protein
VLSNPGVLCYAQSAAILTLVSTFLDKLSQQIVPVSALSNLVRRYYYIHIEASDQGLSDNPKAVLLSFRHYLTPSPAVFEVQLEAIC